MSNSDMDYDAIISGLRINQMSKAADAIDRLLARIAELEDQITGECEHSETLGSALMASGTRIAELEAENEQLCTALHDAIDRPKGVVPESAESFYEPMRCLQAEAQRMGLYGGSEE